MYDGAFEVTSLPQGKFLSSSHSITLSYFRWAPTSKRQKFRWKRYLIVRLTVVLRRMVDVSCDWRFDNLSGSLNRSRGESYVIYLHRTWNLHASMLRILYRPVCHVLSSGSHNNYWNYYFELFTIRKGRTSRACVFWYSQNV